MSMFSQIHVPGPAGLLEIFVLTVVFYYIILFFRGTRSAQVMLGLTFVLVTLLALTQMFHLDAVNWLLKRFSVYLAIAFVIIFQPEIRRALAELGKQHVFTTARERTLVDQIVQAVNLLNETTKTFQVLDDTLQQAPRSWFRNDRRFSFIVRGTF